MHNGNMAASKCSARFLVVILGALGMLGGCERHPGNHPPSRAPVTGVPHAEPGMDLLSSRDERPSTLEQAGFPLERQLDAVMVTVRVVNRERQSVGGGSGVMIGRQDGFIQVLTADHVLVDAIAIDVHAFTPATFPRPAAIFRDVGVLRRSPVQDLALLRIPDDERFTVHPLCPPGPETVPTPPGDPSLPIPVMTVGCGDGRAPAPLLNWILNSPRVRRPGSEQTVRMWQLEQIEVAGRSGGPMFDNQGRLLGISSGTSGQLAYYCHLEEIHRLLNP
jgi:hypothetical protein